MGLLFLGLVILAASKGTEIRVQCIGQSAEKDLIKLINLVKNNFGEEKPLSENINKEMVFKGIRFQVLRNRNCSIKRRTTLSNLEYNIPITLVDKELLRLERELLKFQFLI